MKNHSAANMNSPRYFWDEMRSFVIIWFGQLISTLGSGLTSFALGVYIYQRTGSVTELSIAVLAASLPGVLLSPIAGAVVDRWDRRWILILSDTGAALSTLAIWLLLGSDKLEMWHIYLANAINASLGAFQTPAYMASTTLLVPKNHFGRAAGMGQLSGAISMIVTPILAGFLVVMIKLEGVILIDFVTFLFAILTLAIVRIPMPEVSEEGKAARGSLWSGAGYGWKYLKERPGLLGMLILFAFINFALAFHSVLFTPLILSFADADTLGSILSTGGFGLLVGGMIMSTWGGTNRKIISLMGSLFAFGIAISLAGLRPDPYLIGVASFVFFLLLPIAQGSSQAIWQSKVAPDVQGRVFATRGLIAFMIRPLAMILAGPLADRVFEPLMAGNNTFARSLETIMGTGAGRGIGLVFVIMGIFISLATGIGCLNPRIRNVETELPDAV